MVRTPCFLLALATLLLGCSSSEDNPTQASDAGPETTDGDAQDASQDVTPDVSADVSGDVVDPIATVTILHTAQERGRLAPMPEGATIVGGAANVAGWWKEVEGFDTATHLALSSGASWTGTASSTWLKGENVVDVMGLMGYRAVTLGARDYDFGREALLQRISEASFPFVSANTLYADTGTLVDYVDPYVIVPIDGVPVAVIGLMIIDHDANPADVQDLTFSGYAASVEQYAAEARAKGAKVVVVLTSDFFSSAVQALAASPVDVVLTGWGGPDPTYQTEGDVAFISSVNHWRGYHRVKLQVERETGKVLDRSVDWVAVQYDEADGNPVTPDPTVEAAVEAWEQKAQADLGEEIGFTTTGVSRHSWAMANWITDSWVSMVPQAQIAIQNRGGMQAPIASGPITVGDVVDMLPFGNYVYEIEMTGEQIRTSLSGMLNDCVGDPDCKVAVSGIRYTGNPPTVTLTDGTPLDTVASYRVLVNSYMWWGQGGFPHDPSLVPSHTQLLMRDPVIAWTKQLGTSASDPLENYLDSIPRGD